MGLFPKMFCGFQCIDFERFPPRSLIASLMQLSMMASTKRHGELIADLETDRARLRKPQVMRIGRLASAD